MTWEADPVRLKAQEGVSHWRVATAEFVGSAGIQRLIVGAIVLNAAALGLATDPDLEPWQRLALTLVDGACLALFVLELAAKLAAHRGAFWRNGWNWFDFAVVAIALLPGSGAWSVLRALRVLRVLRLLTVLPQLRKVVAAFLHAIPGLGGVMAVMMVFFYTAGVLATTLFSTTHPQWFGSLGSSLYTLFQIMTLESWSMGIVRPLMESHPWAWAFFVPFIIVATFTILNLFIGIIVSTMQELSLAPDPQSSQYHLVEAVDRMEAELRRLRQAIAESPSGGSAGVPANSPQHGGAHGGERHGASASESSE